MNKYKAILPLMMLLAISFSSCQIEKRHYMSGYSFQWNKKHHTLMKDLAGREPKKSYTEKKDLQVTTSITDSKTNATEKIVINNPSAEAVFHAINSPVFQQGNTTKNSMVNDISTNDNVTEIAANTSVSLHPQPIGGGGNGYYMKWILCLVAALVCFLLGAILLGGFFWFVGGLFFIAAVVFFVLWLMGS